MANTQTQKALVIAEVGKPLVLVHDRPIPSPGPGQVLLKVKVAGINPHDGKAREFGLFVKDNLPAVITNDVVGVVTAVGEGVSDVAVGDRIVSQADFDAKYTQTGLQEYALADAVARAKIPAAVTDDEAATLPTNIIAPLVALFEALKIPAPWSPAAKTFDYAGATLLVVGGGANCGKFGVQLAKLAGIGRIVVVGGDEAELKEYGATHVLDRHGGFDAVLGHIRDVVGDDLIYAYDPINPPDGQLLAVSALSSHTRGALARLLPLGPVDESKVVGKKAGFDVINVFGSSQLHHELAKGFWERLPAWLETGEIRPLRYVVKQGLEPGAVNEVLDAYRDGKPVAKTHIHL